MNAKIATVNESTKWGVSPAGHRFVRHYESSKVEGAKAHARYLAVAPSDLIPKLSLGGLKVDVVQSRYTGKGQAILTCTTDTIRENYAGQCHILLDHRGRASVKLKGGVLRVSCANAFYAPAYTFHHCGEELREFVEDPASWVWNVINGNMVLAGRVESLRGDFRGEWLLRAFRNARPRLAAPVVPVFHEYQWQDNDCPSTWAFVQALTATRGRNGRKVRALEAIASRTVDTLYRGAPVTPELFASAAFN